MRFPKIISAFFFAFIITGCSKDKAVEPEVIHENIGLVGLSLLLHQSSPAGLAGILEPINEVTAKGINLFGMSPEWAELETAPYTYSFQNQLVNPLTLTDPGNTKFKSYLLVLKVIDTHRKTVPADLSALSFDDPAVISRFKSLIDSLSALPPINRISHVLMGNEVDGYLSAHPTQLNAFSTFYQQSINHIHAKMPWVKVGTIITFSSVAAHPAIFNTLMPSSDFIGYTYYPTDNANPYWQMRSPAEVTADVAFMAQKTGGKPFAFTEIGYASSTANNSSEDLQKQFVENMFDALHPYKDKGQLAFIFYHGLFDYPPGFCVEYAQSQGIDPAYLCGFMNSLGLKDYVTGQPKQAWNAFFNRLAKW